MQIIVEGPDGSGKTTLIEALAQVTGWKVIPGEGPEKGAGEIITRIFRIVKEERYAQAYASPPRIYDRHPCVSQSVYGRVFMDRTIPKDEHLEGFYRLSSLFVYCVPPSKKHQTHDQEKPHDVGEHLEGIIDRHETICHLYDQWALEHAHIIYRYWEPEALTRTIQAIIAATGE